MSDSRLKLLERRIEQIAKAVNELQSRMDLVQNEFNASLALEQLGGKITLTDSSGNENIRKPQIPKSMMRSVKEFVGQEGKWLSAEEIAKKTRRSRNAESSYLQRLFEKGYLIRQRNGRNVYYSIRRDALKGLEES